MKYEECDFDGILHEVGALGRFQRLNFLLLSAVIGFTAMPLVFMFTTRTTNYRCYVEGCDNPDIDKATYHVPWIQDAIPFVHDKPIMCTQYIQTRIPEHPQQCNISHFNHEYVRKCDRFIFENGDATIERDFNLTCMENLWKLSLVGSMGDLSEIIGLPIFGYISDRYGRRNVMVIALVASSIIGTLKSYLNNYEWFLFFELVETFIGSGIFGAAYVLAIELVTAKRRILVSTLLICTFALGEAYLCLIAFISESWRQMLRLIYIPGLLFISYFYLLNESIRWLLVKGKIEEAQKILTKVYKTNGIAVNTHLGEKLRVSAYQMEDASNESLRIVFQSRTLTIRFICYAFVWLTCTFVFYGFNMKSILISGNLYLNYTLSVLIEIPANIICFCLLNNGRRKRVLCFSLFLTGFICFLLLVLSLGEKEIILFSLGKCSISIALSTIYVYAAEVFPTSVRHSLLSCCSIFGRIGGMAAPQIPLMMQISPILVYLLFMLMTLLSSTLVLTFPESVNTKLPDTVSQAVAIGNRTSDK